MSRLLKQVERSLNIKAKPKPAEPDGFDGHMSQAIKQAVQPEVAAQVREALQDLPAMVRDEVQQTASAEMNLLARKHARGVMEERTDVAPHRRDFTDQPLSSTYPAVPPPMAKKPIPPITLQKDRAGKTVSVSVGSDLTFTIQRDAAGKLIGMTQE